MIFFAMVASVLHFQRVTRGFELWTYIQRNDVCPDTRKHKLEDLFPEMFSACSWPPPPLSLWYLSVPYLRSNANLLAVCWQRHKPPRMSADAVRKEFCWKIPGRCSSVWHRAWICPRGWKEMLCIWSCVVWKTPRPDTKNRSSKNKDLARWIPALLLFDGPFISSL